MNLWEYITTAIDNLKCNKIRSFLTMLGVIIGVANISLVVAILQGGRESILDELGGLGSNLIYVNNRLDADIPGYMTEEEIKGIAKIPTIVNITPEVFLSTKIKIREKEKDIWVVGTSPDFKEIQEITILKGRGLLWTDVEFQRKVCIISDTIAKDFFKGKEVIGKEIRIKKINFKIIGLMQEKKMLGFEKLVGDTFYIPYTTALRILGTKEIPSAIIQVKDTSQIDCTISTVKEFLKKRHNGKDLFELQTLKEILSTVNVVTGIIALVIGGVAGISLLVGGIGIMNIMLVSIGERAREIGIRKAIGAKDKEILTQFLIESGTLSLIGGIIGIIIGIFGAKVVGVLFEEIPVLISWQAIAVGFVVSSGVGVIFGIYPAKCASVLTPVEALRYE